MSQTLEQERALPLQLPRAGFKGITANFSWQLAGEGSGKALAFVAALYMARVLGVEGFGQFSYAWVILTYGMVAADSGLGYFGTREVAKDNSLLGRVAVNVTVIRLVIALLLAAGVLALSLLFAGPSSPWTLYLFTFMWLFPYAINPDWAFRGLEKMGYSASWNVMHQVVFLLLMLLFVKSGADLLAVPLFKTAGAFAASSVLWLLLMKKEPRARQAVIKGEVDARLWPGFLKASVPMGASYAMTLLIMNIGTVMLGIMSTPKVVGWYAAGYNIFVQITVICSLVASSFYPRLSYVHGRDRAAFVKLFKTMMLVTAGGGLLVSAFIFAASGPLVLTLLGSSYYETIAPLKVLSAAIFLGFMTTSLGCAFNSAGLERVSLAVVAAGAAANICLNLVLIPRYSMQGAAASTVISYAVILLLYFAVLKRTVLRAR